MVKYNVGIDSRFLEDRLSFSADGYYDNNYSYNYNYKLGTPWRPYGSTGSSVIHLDKEVYDAYGLEFSLAWKDKIGSDFYYRVKLNAAVSDTRRRVKDSDGYSKDGTPWESTDLGKWGFRSLGMFSSKEEVDRYKENSDVVSIFDVTRNYWKPGMLYYEDTHKDNVIDKKDLVRLSKRLQNNSILSLNLGAGWKGLNLDALITASWGAYPRLRTFSFGLNLTL